ncbi:MAG: alpha/beta hydrolase [Myxococcota bacterium]
MGGGATVLRGGVLLVVGMPLLAGSALSCNRDAPAVPAPAAVVAPKVTGPTPDRVVTFKQVGDVSLSLHVFEPRGDPPVTGRPAFVLFHGGAWSEGSPRDYYRHCAELASAGVAAFCAEYRVSKRHHTTPWEAVRDGKSAVRWVRAHARELGVDPQRVIAAGASAGGHVAACAALIDGLDEADEDRSISSRPDALVLFFAVVDTSPTEGFGADVLGPRYRELSPREHIRANLPPTIMFHGTVDHVMPHATVERFCAEMRRHDNPCELLSHSGRGHTFMNPDEPSSDYTDVMTRTLRFIRTLEHARR